MLFIIIVAFMFILDQNIKDSIEKRYTFTRNKEILKGNIIVKRLHNRGAFMSFMDKKPYVVKVISIGFVIGIAIAFFSTVFKTGKFLFKLGLSLFFAGALSNVYDRIKRGFVVDYFSFKRLRRIVFNIADMCIFIGGIMLLIVNIFKNNK